MWQDRPRHPEAVCVRLLDSLLVEPDRLRAEWAPDGWEHSPLLRSFLSGRSEPPGPQEAAVELLGRALWDVFSNNHTVLDTAGMACDLGSFRSTAGFIAESLNRRYPDLGDTRDYVDFYMGTLVTGVADDLRPVYRWIFARLRDAGWRWIYSFPGDVARARHASLPTIVAAHRDAYGVLPEGWPHSDT